MEFKDLIYNYRKEHRLSQEEFGSKIGATKSTVSTWELGKRTPSASLLAAISRTYDISIDKLLESIGTDPVSVSVGSGKGPDYIQLSQKTARERFENLSSNEYREIMSKVAYLLEKLDGNTLYTSFEENLIKAYNDAPDNIKITICTLLGLEEEKHEN